jgi:NAD(P)-dependent dehydrogenase (short-subunit alcohol dehydrogenase family)
LHVASSSGFHNTSFLPQWTKISATIYHPQLAMSRYASVYANPQGPGDARPTAWQIIEDHGVKDRLTGKVAVITGGTAGLGLETTRALAATGMKLYLTARDLARAKEALKDLFTSQQITLVHMEQSSFDSVRKAASEILASTSQIDILVANAGVMAVPELTLTDSGHELQFATNHLGHFLFFQLLKPALLNAGTPSSPSKVIALSASAHRIQGINSPDNYAFQQGGYTPWGAYGQSKIANIYMASYIDRHFANQNVRACSINPGISSTGIGKYVDSETFDQIMAEPSVPKGLRSVPQGAATTVWAAVCDLEAEGAAGKYLVDCAVAGKGKDDGNRVSPTTVSWTYDDQMEERLWKDSLRMVGLES